MPKRPTKRTVKSGFKRKTVKVLNKKSAARRLHPYNKIAAKKRRAKGKRKLSKLRKA